MEKTDKSAAILLLYPCILKVVVRREYSGDEVGGKEAQEIVDRAKKLIEK